MLQFLLIRPGSTEYDRQGRIQGTLDIPLNDAGCRQVARVADDLKSQPITALYVTPCQSAQQTGQAIAESIHLKPKKLDKLHNLDQGLWQGMLVEDVKTKQPKVYRQWREQPELVCPPGGEMLGTARERVRQVIGRLLKKHKEGMVAMVVPEPMASVVCNVLRQDALTDLWGNGDGSRWETITVQPDAAVCE